MAELKLGQKIRVVRQLKGYSQEYMAMLLGISQNGYSKIERGEICVKNERLREISRILGIPAYNLYRITGTILVFNDSDHPAAPQGTE